MPSEVSGKILEALRRLGWVSKEEFEEATQELATELAKARSEADLAESALKSLYGELATLLGPRKPRPGVSYNDLWIEAVGSLLRDIDETSEKLAALREEQSVAMSQALAAYREELADRSEGLPPAVEQWVELFPEPAQEKIRLFLAASFNVQAQDVAKLQLSEAAQALQLGHWIDFHTREEKRCLQENRTHEAQRHHGAKEAMEQMSRNLTPLFREINVA